MLGWMKQSIAAQWLEESRQLANHLAYLFADDATLRLSHREISGKHLDRQVVSLVEWPGRFILLSMVGQGSHIQLIEPGGQTPALPVVLGYWSAGRGWVRGLRDHGAYTPDPYGARYAVDDCATWALDRGLALLRSGKAAAAWLLALPGCHVWLRWEHDHKSYVQDHRSSAVLVGWGDDPAALLRWAKIQGRPAPGYTTRIALHGGGA